jgi:hypothetical protein
MRNEVGREDEGGKRWALASDRAIDVVYFKFCYRFFFEVFQFPLRVSAINRRFLTEIFLNKTTFSKGK